MTAVKILGQNTNHTVGNVSKGSSHCSMERLAKILAYSIQGLAKILA